MGNLMWSEAVNLEFVKLYMKHECLWNPVHPLYKLKYLRKKAHADIISEFQSITNISLSVADVANKIKNLRTGYGNNLLRIARRKKLGRTYKPTKSWFHEMDRYLKQVPGHRHSVIHSQETIEHSEEEDNEQQNNVIDIDSDDSLPLVIEESDKERENNNQEENEIKFEVLRSPLQCPVTQNPLHSVAGINIEDEFSIYGKFIASHLRKMSSQNALKLEHQIQNLISEAKLSNSHSEF